MSTQPLKYSVARSIAEDVRKVITRMEEYQKMQPTSGVNDSISKLKRVESRLLEDSVAGTK